jgi:uncharacterized protein YrzB (UPF0473 family)
MDENRSHIVQLQDADGNDVDFEHLMTLEHMGNCYVVLEAAQDMEDCMEGEAVVLKIIQDENGEDMYVTIEDEGELRAVFNRCLAILDEQEDEEASDEE